MVGSRSLLPLAVELVSGPPRLRFRSAILQFMVWASYFTLPGLSFLSHGPCSFFGSSRRPLTLQTSVSMEERARGGEDGDAHWDWAPMGYVPRSVDGTGLV